MGWYALKRGVRQCRGNEWRSVWAPAWTASGWSCKGLGNGGYHGAKFLRAEGAHVIAIAGTRRCDFRCGRF